MNKILNATIYDPVKYFYSREKIVKVLITRWKFLHIDRMNDQILR